MKQLQKPFTLFFSLMLLYATISAQQVRAVQPGPPGSWRELGNTVVKFTVDHDAIAVAGADNFRALKFKVFDASVRILNMSVVYENGEPEKLDVRYLIPANGESRVIDLRGGSRRIRRVDFWYQSGAAGFRGRAKVSLWGIK